MFRRQWLIVVLVGGWGVAFFADGRIPFAPTSVAAEGTEAGPAEDPERGVATGAGEAAEEGAAEEKAAEELGRGGKAISDETAARGGREITLDELPPPPPPIRQLIESGRVRFRVGGTPPESQEPGDREMANARDSGGAVGRSSGVSDGITAYRVSFEYDSESRWRVVGSGARRQLVVTVRFPEVRWQTNHEVWLRRPIPADRFWEDPLVLHELDHVRISADRSLRDRFATKLGERSELRIPLAADETVTSRGVQAQIDKHVHETHQRVCELIEIRYRELDRLTAHGQRPIPEGTELEAMLRQPATTPRPASAGADRTPVGWP